MKVYGHYIFRFLKGKVPKNRLLENLKAHGINGDILIWIDEWLTNRGQRVVFNGQ